MTIKMKERILKLYKFFRHCERYYEAACLREHFPEAFKIIKDIKK